MAALQLNTSTSIIDFLKSTGRPSDFSSRESLYNSSGLAERLGKYVSSGSQNIAFLKNLNKPTETPQASGIPGLAGGTPLSGGKIPNATSVVTGKPVYGPDAPASRNPAQSALTGIPGLAGGKPLSGGQLPGQGIPGLAGGAPLTNGQLPRKGGSIQGLQGGDIVGAEITANQALQNVMGGGTTQPGKVDVSVADESIGDTTSTVVTDTTGSTPAFGPGGIPNASDIGLSLPGEGEIADAYFNSPEYKALKEKYDLEGLGAAALAQTAKEDLEAKYAADKAQLEMTLGRNGLFMSGIRSSQVAALAQSLAMQTNQVDRTTAQKLLESDANFKADIIKGIGELFKEAKADNKEALAQLNQAGFALIGGQIVPTLAAQRYQTDQEKDKFTQDLAIASFNQKLDEFSALERQRATQNAIDIKRLNISMQNANTSAERNTILNQIREITLLQKTAAAPGQIISAATGLPVKLTKEQTDYYAGVGSMVQTQIPSITALLGKVTTGGATGRYMTTAAGLPFLQSTLSIDQQAIIQQISQMNNSLVYLLSGKQINQQEFERLKLQMPSLNYTNSQNTVQMTNFSTTMSDIYQRNLTLNGFAIAGTEAGDAATNILLSEASSGDPLDDLASGFMTTE